MNKVTLTLLSASTLTVMAGATIAPALPAISDQFAGQPNLDWWVRLLLTITALAIVLSGPVAGWIMDRFNPARVLLVGVVMYLLAGTSGLWLDTLPGLLAGRILLGVSVALVMTAATTLIGALFEGAERAKIMGLQAAAMSAGGVLFLAAGGILAEFSWRGPFALYALAIVIAVGAWIWLPSTPTRPAGQAQGPLPKTLLAGLMSLAMLAMTVFYLIPVQYPFYLRALGWDSPLAIGGSMSLMTVVSAFASMQFSRLVQHHSFQRLIVAGLGLFALAMLALGLAPTPILAMAACVSSGVGLGLLMPCYMGWLNQAIHPTRRGQANGLLVTSMFMGHFVSPLFSVPIAANLGFSAAFIAGAALSAGAAVVVWVLQRRQSPVFGG